MPAGIYSFTIEQGATFQRTITWKDVAGNPINLTNWTGRMQVRETLAATTVILSLTTENGGITLGGLAGTISVLATPTTTSAIVVKKGVYDLELQSPSGAVTRLLEGKVTISQEVTR